MNKLTNTIINLNLNIGTQTGIPISNIISEDVNYKLIKLKYQDLTNYKIRNWKNNRPSDKFRVDEIYNYLNNYNIKLLPGIIYCWYSNKYLFIYDGIHRYDALKKLNNPNIELLLYINLTENEKLIINDFININKSIPLPDIYTEDESKNKIDICEKIASELCKKYPKFVSTRKNPHTYNFNRDQIIDYISTFNIDFNINNLDYILFQMFIKLNDKAKNDILEKNIICPKKCEQYDFYLFYLKKDFIKSEIENKLQKFVNN